jgi:hypothetical protein
VAELPLLRRPVPGPARCKAGRAPHVAGLPALRGRGFITPMAAVAGAVAQELIAPTAQRHRAPAWVNNGGDIALHLAPGESARRAWWPTSPPSTRGAGRAPPDAHRRPLRAARTSPGARRGHQRLARPQLLAGHRRQRHRAGRHRGEADAAATVIANAVDVDDAAHRARAGQPLRDDSDLGAIAGHRRGAAAASGLARRR